MKEVCVTYVLTAVEPSKEDGQGGWTLLELLFGLVILIVAMGAIVQIFGSSVDGFNEVAAMGTADQQMRQVLDRLVIEMRDVDAGSISPATPSAATSLTFSPVIGWDGSNPTLDTARTVTFANNEVTLDSNVIQGGVESLTFTQIGDVLEIRVQVEREVHQRGTTRVVMSEMATQINLR